MHNADDAPTGFAGGTLRKSPRSCAFASAIVVGIACTAPAVRAQSLPRDTTRKQAQHDSSQTARAAALDNRSSALLGNLRQNLSPLQTLAKQTRRAVPDHDVELLLGGGVRSAVAYRRTDGAPGDATGVLAEPNRPILAVARRLHPEAFQPRLDGASLVVLIFDSVGTLMRHAALRISFIPAQIRPDGTVSRGTYSDRQVLGEVFSDEAISAFASWGLTTLSGSADLQHVEGAVLFAYLR